MRRRPGGFVLLVSAAIIAGAMASGACAPPEPKLPRACQGVDRDAKRLIRYSREGESYVQAQVQACVEREERKAAKARSDRESAQSRAQPQAAASPSSDDDDAPATPRAAASAPTDLSVAPPGQPPTLVQVERAVTSATPKALAGCGMTGKPVLVAVTVEVKTTGKVAGVRFEDVIARGGGVTVPQVAAPAVRGCLERAYVELVFPEFTLPPETGKLSTRYTCPAGLSDIQSMHPEKYCTRYVADSRSYGSTILVTSDGAASNPTAAEAGAFVAKLRTSAHASSCADTKEAGIPPGTYSGNRGRTFTAGAEGDVAPGTVCKVAEWRSLRVTIDDDGCASWLGMAFDDGECTGDAQRNLEKIPFACIEEGDAAFARTGKELALRATVSDRSATATPVRFHLWRCPKLGNVRTDLATDLRAQGCVALGNDVEPRDERMARAACGMSRAFDDDLARAPVSIDKEGAMRVTLKDGPALLLRRIDRK